MPVPELELDAAIGDDDGELWCSTVAANADTYDVGNDGASVDAEEPPVGDAASPAARTPSQAIRLDALNTRIRLETMAPTANMSTDSLREEGHGVEVSKVMSA